jgi:signal transduction histidine kinase
VRLEVTGGQPPLVSVEDHGVGIDPELAERVFERFYRVNDPALGYPPGTGLGLYISRDLAQRSGGALVLERSTPREGSRFSFSLRPPTWSESEAPTQLPAPAASDR